MLHLSLIAVICLAVLLQVLRIVLRTVIKDAKLLLYVDEYLANIQSSACIMELGVIASVYGSASWIPISCVFLFLFTKFTLVGIVGVVGNPLTFLMSIYTNGRVRNFSVFHVALIIAIQIGGCLSGQHLMKYVWNHMTHDHISARDAMCLTAISGDWIKAMIAESGCVFFSVLVDFKTPKQFKPLIAALVSVVTAVLFGHYSGIFMNPIIATAHTFRCSGHASDWQHFLVYWAGPALAVCTAFELNSLTGGKIKTE